MWFILFIMTVATSRITRGITRDSLFEKPRMWLHLKLATFELVTEFIDGQVRPHYAWKGKPGLKGWIYKLITCQLCVGTWVSGAVVLVWALWADLSPVFSVTLWLTVSLLQWYVLLVENRLT